MDAPGLVPASCARAAHESIPPLSAACHRPTPLSHASRRDAPPHGKGSRRRRPPPPPPALETPPAPRRGVRTPHRRRRGRPAPARVRTAAARWRLAGGRPTRAAGTWWGGGGSAVVTRRAMATAASAAVGPRPLVGRPRRPPRRPSTRRRRAEARTAGGNGGNGGGGNGGRSSNGNGGDGGDSGGGVEWVQRPPLAAPTGPSPRIACLSEGGAASVAPPPLPELVGHDATPRGPRTRRVEGPQPRTRPIH